MLTIHVWPRWLKEFLLTHPLYKSPPRSNRPRQVPAAIHPSFQPQPKHAKCAVRFVRRWPKAPPRGTLGEYAISPRSDLRSPASLPPHIRVLCKRSAAHRPRRCRAAASRSLPCPRRPAPYPRRKDKGSRTRNDFTINAPMLGASKTHSYC